MGFIFVVGMHLFCALSGTPGKLTEVEFVGFARQGDQIVVKVSAPLVVFYQLEQYSCTAITKVNK